MMIQGYFTTADIATAIGVSIKTVMTLVDSGTLSSTLSDGGHRRIHGHEMERVTMAGRWADGLVTTAPRGEVVLAALRHANLPVSARPVDLFSFVYGVLSARMGAGFSMQMRPA